MDEASIIKVKHCLLKEIMLATLLEWNRKWFATFARRLCSVISKYFEYKYQQRNFTSTESIDTLDASFKHQIVAKIISLNR